MAMAQQKTTLANTLYRQKLSLRNVVVILHCDEVNSNANRISKCVRTSSVAAAATARIDAASEAAVVAVIVLVRSARECVTLHGCFASDKNQSQKVDMTKLELISLNSLTFCMRLVKSATVQSADSLVNCSREFREKRKVVNKLNVRAA